MNTYIIKEKKFQFNEKESFDLSLLGKTSMQLLKDEFPDAECITEEDFDLKKFDCTNGALIIKSSYPLFNNKMAEKVIDFYKKNNLSSLKFIAGAIISKGKAMLTDSIEIPCGSALDSLSSYPVVLEEVRKKILFSLMENGVMIENPESTYVSFDALVEKGAVIMHDNHITGNCVIKSGAIIQPYCNLKDTVIGHNTVVTSSTTDGAIVGDDTTVGPNAFLRPKAVIGNGCRIGDFVEIKNANIGDGTKVSHLSYVGDADVGKKVNVGCGVVFVNYDGRHKHRSTIGNECFLGSNCNLIAPVVLEDNSFVAAGTTLTKDLKSGDFCIGRCRETIKNDRSYNYFGTKKN